ncbi:MAG: KEOPS complex subunit Cgi121 [Thermoplasmataceae archaeon]
MPEVSRIIFSPGDLAGILDYVSGTRSFFQLARRESIISIEHIEIAYERMKRSISNGVGTRDPGVLFLMYLTGNHQTSPAIEAAGVRIGDSECVAIYETRKDMDGLLDRFRSAVEKHETGIPETNPGMDEALFETVNSVETRIYAKNRAKWKP